MVRHHRKRQENTPCGCLVAGIVVAVFAGLGGAALIWLSGTSENICNYSTPATLIVDSKNMQSSGSADSQTYRCDVCLKSGIQTFADYYYASSSLIGATSSSYNTHNTYCGQFTVDSPVSMYILADMARDMCSFYSDSVSAVTPTQKENACSYGGYQKIGGIACFCLVPIFIAWGILGCIKMTATKAAKAAALGAVVGAGVGAVSGGLANRGHGETSNPLTTMAQQTVAAYTPSPAPAPGPVSTQSPQYPPAQTAPAPYGQPSYAHAPQNPAQTGPYGAPGYGAGAPPAPAPGVYSAYGAPAQPDQYGQNASSNPGPAYIPPSQADQAFY
ncbi:hypothetical protein KIPB_001988 [Kipferlia bialata]|uniref:Uncharacterized protein n=1 Tax=Kipferlia bialata TaxID=797122 RepID=A0A9K3CRR6_9EUKA|nr:hypothetical protein KIPB_001988 [Kipferlia bialata]|eukprot:g1988.t1